MKDVKELIKIADNIGMKQAEELLNAIAERQAQAEPGIVIPFVGEFSSGKTSLINALTDSKSLEAKTEPTTATIYEVHFSQPKCDAYVYEDDNNFTHVDNIADLKNDNLVDKPFVLVNDTSTKIPETTIIVDTPGLSSPEPKHKETLVKFLPKADGIILVVDVNQQVTRSLSQFINDIQLSNRPIFLVLSKCDTKSDSEVKAAKDYIAQNCKIPIEQVACVSAHKGNLSELYALFKSISDAKASILEKVNEQRIKNIAIAMSKRIDELLNASDDNKKLEIAIREQKDDLSKIKNKIKKILANTKNEIDENADNAIQEFVTTVTPKLEAIAKSQNMNFDNEAITAVNTTEILVLNNFKRSISQILRSKANLMKNTDDGIDLQSLQLIDMSNVQVGDATASYSLSLNDMGHEYDSIIKKGVVGVALVGATIATGGLAGGAAAGGAAAGGAAAGGAAAGGAAAGGATLMDVAQVAADVYLYKKLSDSNNENLPAQQQPNQQPAQVVEQRGIIDSAIGWVTDKAWGKPQRQKAVREYLNNTLIPAFKIEMARIQDEMIAMIQNTLNNESEATISEKTQELEKLKAIGLQHKQELENRKAELRRMKGLLADY